MNVPPTWMLRPVLNSDFPNSTRMPCSEPPEDVAYAPEQYIGCHPWIQAVAGAHQPGVVLDVNSWDSPDLAGFAGRWSYKHDHLGVAHAQSAGRPLRRQTPWPYDPHKDVMVDNHQSYDDQNPASVYNAARLDYDSFGRAKPLHLWRHPTTTDMRLPPGVEVQPEQFDYNNSAPPSRIVFPHSTFRVDPLARYPKHRVLEGIEASGCVDRRHAHVPHDPHEPCMVSRPNDRAYDAGPAVATTASELGTAAGQNPYTKDSAAPKHHFLHDHLTEVVGLSAGLLVLGMYVRSVVGA